MEGYYGVCQMTQIAAALPPASIFFFLLFFFFNIFAQGRDEKF